MVRSIVLHPDGFAAATAELGAGGITGITFATEDLDRLRRAPIERGCSNWNSTASTKLRPRCIFVVTARARHATRHLWRCVQFTRDGLKGRVATPAAVLNTLRKTRLAFRTHHDYERRRVSTVFTIKTATTRRS